MTLDYYSCAFVVLAQLPLPSNTVGCCCVFALSAVHRSEHAVHSDADAGPVDVAEQQQWMYYDSNVAAFVSYTFVPFHSLTWKVTVQSYWKSFVSFG